MMLFTREEVRWLTARRYGPYVSLLMPLHPGTVEGQQDPIRFKNLVRQARESLNKLGLRRAAIDSLLTPANALQGDPQIWRSGGHGLAVFISQGRWRSYQVPRALPELATVSTEFHLKPMLRLLHGDGTFYVLAVSLNSVRLFQCTRHLADPVEIPDAPTSLEDLAADSDSQRIVNVHSSAARPGGGRFGRAHGHGDGGGLRKEQLLDYFRHIDRGLRGVLQGEQGPLVLAGVDYYLPLYQQVNTYPALHPASVEGSPDELSGEQLRERAWELVQPVFSAARRADGDRYHNLRATGRTSRDLGQIYEAACPGQVKTLFVAVGVQRWGRYDREACTYELHDHKQPGDVDLLNEVAVQTLLRGGTVYAVEPDELPDQRGEAVANAVFRW